MNIYIGYRNLASYFQENSTFGKAPENHDQRLTTIRDGVYLLTFDDRSYAVTKDAAERFIDEVFRQCQNEHRGFFPLEPSFHGKSTAAVIEKQDERGRYSYFEMDDEILLQMLTELKEKCGDPLDERALINYSYPNAELPEEFELRTICHQIYMGPNTPSPSVVQTAFPDKNTSCFQIQNDKASLQLQDGGNTLLYEVPMELLSDIKEKVRELCLNPAEAYVNAGEYESFIRFGKKDERIFTDPRKTLSLLQEIASRSVFVSSSVSASFSAVPSFGSAFFS